MSQNRLATFTKPIQQNKQYYDDYSDDDDDDNMMCQATCIQSKQSTHKHPWPMDACVHPKAPLPVLA